MDAADHRNRKLHRETNDAPIEATPEEVQAIRDQLAEIEQSLSRLWGPTIWSRTPECIRIRGEAADLIDKHFDGIVEQWGESIAYIIHGHQKFDKEGRQDNMVNSLIRFVDHLRDPDDICTYVYLRRHCQEGMLARAKPSQFNVIHIALKQIVLNHVKLTSERSGDGAGARFDGRGNRRAAPDGLAVLYRIARDG